MGYTPTTWVNKQTRLNADNLNHLERAVMENHGQRVIALGDSITQGGDAEGARPSWQGSIWSHLAILSRHRFHLVRNAGIGGNTTAQMLARFDADVLAHKPGIVTIAGGTNDRNGGTLNISDTCTNLTTLVQKAKAAGIVPVLVTAPPTDVAGNGAFSTVEANRAGVDTLNRWIRSYARQESIALIDLHRYWVAPATGGYRAGYSDDGTHPSQTAVAAAVSALLAGDLPDLFRGRLDLALSNTDRSNLSENALALTDSDSNNIPDKWYFPDSAAVTVTPSEVGNWVNIASGSDGKSAYAPGTAAFKTGDVIAFMGRVKQPAGVTSTVALIEQTGYQSLATPMANFGQPVGDGAFYMEYTVEANISAVGVYAIAIHGNGGALSIAQETVVNLTALGLAPRGS